LRFTNGGKAVCSMGLACSRRYQQNGEWVEKTSFVNLTVWDTLGENCAASFYKGTRVIVNGRLEMDDYENRDGEKRVSANIIVDAIGPELKWATCTVERIQRSEGGRQSDGQGGGNSSRPSAQQPEPYYGGGDEEPF
jgi:single-strand DNA-binding protein